MKRGKEGGRSSAPVDRAGEEKEGGHAGNNSARIAARACELADLALLRGGSLGVARA